jgi:thymidylate synthase
LRYVKVGETQYGNKQRELQSISWTIDSEEIENFYLPDWPEEVQNRIGLSTEMREQYRNAFLNPIVPQGTSYTYGSRLNNYPGEVNQIQEIIHAIKQSSITRRAVATTFYPAIDSKSENPPCLTQIQILVSGGKINFFAIFRSHDIFKAAIPNAYGLLNLQKYIAQETNLKIGKMTVTSISAHIYEEDWEMAQKLVKCSIWDREKKKFDEQEDIDPRGLIRISVQKNEIFLELISQNGEQLFEYYGKTAREVALKVAHLDLLSRSDHYCDMSIELTKAELSLKTNIDYIQDRPLQISGITLI